MSYKGYINPITMPCWELCGSCFRCSEKGRYAKCEGCSGRNDPQLKREADPDDFCQCSQGVLRYKTQKGQLIIRKFETNPFKGKVRTDAETPDERDWQSYLAERRSALGDPNYDPIQFDDGSSVSAWTEAMRKRNL